MNGSKSWCPCCGSTRPAAPSLSIAARDGAVVVFCHRCHASGNDLIRALIYRGLLPDSRATEICDRIRAAIDATTWAGRNGSTDRDVFAALVEIASKGRQISIHPGVRKIAELIGSSRATTARSLRRLERAGWLQEISTANGEATAATWRFCVSRALGAGSRPDRVAAVGGSVVAGSYRHSTFHAPGLRGVKQRIYEMLVTPRRASEVAAILKHKRVRAAQKHLAVLVRFDLARRRGDGRYERGDADLDQLAKKLGVADATARQRAQHAADRVEWRQWCRALEHYAATGEVLDPQNGEVLGVAKKPERPIRLHDFRSLVIARRANNAELDRSAVNAPSQRVSGEESSLIHRPGEITSPVEQSTYRARSARVTAITLLKLLTNLEARGIRVEPVPGRDALIVQPVALLSDADRQAILSNRKLLLELVRARDACRAADADVTGALLPTGRMPVARELAAILRTIADANLQTIRSVLEAFECELIFRGGSIDSVFDAGLPEGAN